MLCTGGFFHLICVYDCLSVPDLAHTQINFLPSISADLPVLDTEDVLRDGDPSRNVADRGQFSRSQTEYNTAFIFVNLYWLELPVHPVYPRGCAPETPLQKTVHFACIRYTSPRVGRILSAFASPPREDSVGRSEVTASRVAGERRPNVVGITKTDRPPPKSDGREVSRTDRSTRRGTAERRFGRGGRLRPMTMSRVATSYRVPGRFELDRYAVVSAVVDPRLFGRVDSAEGGIRAMCGPDSERGDDGRGGGHEEARLRTPALRASSSGALSSDSSLQVSSATGGPSLRRVCARSTRTHAVRW